VLVPHVSTQSPHRIDRGCELSQPGTSRVSTPCEYPESPPDRQRVRVEPARHEPLHPPVCTAVTSAVDTDSVRIAALFVLFAGFAAAAHSCRELSQPALHCLYSSEGYYYGTHAMRCHVVSCAATIPSCRIAVSCCCASQRRALCHQSSHCEVFARAVYSATNAPPSLVRLPQ
jgi:hypothetical protein